MICGLKWKTCNCPWFSNVPVEDDRLNNLPVEIDAARPVPRRPRWEDLRHPVPLLRATSPPPMLRRHTARESAYNSAHSTRPSERVVPRRTRTDYEAEAAVHMPLSMRSRDLDEGRSAVLAGLAGIRRGSNRVNAWQMYVELGVTPEEGLLSM